MRLRNIMAGALITVLSSPAIADCFDDAAAYHGVNPWILRGIAMVESGGCRGNLVNRNSNGSVDVGCTQTNSIHFKELRKYGIAANDLMDACNSIYVSGWLLKKKMLRHGNTWKAVGAYHSETPHLRDAYAAKVRRYTNQWQLSQ